LRRVCVLPGRSERLIEHCLGAISHAPPDRVRTRGPETFGDQSSVRRVDKIGRRIGNRPIEVENDCSTVNGLPPILSALAASVKNSGIKFYLMGGHRRRKTVFFQEPDGFTSCREEGPAGNNCRRNKLLVKHGDDHK